MPTQINITGESIQEESSNNQLQYQTQGEDEESGRVLRRERSPSRRAQERALMMAERKRKRDEAKEAQERKRQEYQERQRVAQARREQMQQRLREREAARVERERQQREREAARQRARLQRERELAERRALVQARLRPALHCNMDDSPTSTCDSLAFSYLVKTWINSILVIPATLSCSASPCPCEKY
jgi:hypothetical protein